jgi:hypothetical protein
MTNSDLKMREAAAGRGEDLNTLPRQYAQLINAALRDRPAGMTVGKTSYALIAFLCSFTTRNSFMPREFPQSPFRRRYVST